jgi:hypothetical protein
MPLMYKYDTDNTHRWLLFAFIFSKYFPHISVRRITTQAITPTFINFKSRMFVI